MDYETIFDAVEENFTTDEVFEDVIEEDEEIIKNFREAVREFVFEMLENDEAVYVSKPCWTCDGGCMEFDVAIIERGSMTITEQHFATEY